MSDATKKITQEDLASLHYFWFQKGDLTRWVFWEEKLPDLRREYPEIVKAWEDYKAADRILDHVIKGVQP